MRTLKIGLLLLLMAGILFAFYACVCEQARSATLSGTYIQSGTLPVSAIHTTAGTAGSTTFLRGDGTWSLDYFEALISGGTSGEYINGVGSLVAFPSIPAALSFSLPLSNSSGTVSINAATESAAGSMSSADKTKLDGIASGATAGITALTGDVTASGSGSQAATLATVNSSPGSFGDSTHTVTATVDAKGRITALSANAIGTLNQSTTGNALTATTAANLSGTPALPNGVTATTQSAGDNSTNLATTAYADRMLPLGGGTLTGGLTGKTGAWTGNSTFTPASAAGVAISHAAGIDSDTLRLHKMDPLTTHKNCPGRNCSVEFDTIKRDVHAYIASRNNG